MAYHTIILKNSEFCPQVEAKAAEAGIYPGHFLDWTSTGTLELQDESGTTGPKIVAVEDSLQGKKISDVYTSGRQVLARYAVPGTEVYAWLAKGHSVTIGDLLEFAGYEEPGCLGKAEYTSASKGAGVVAQALETIDNSSGSSGARIRVRMV